MTRLNVDLAARVLEELVFDLGEVVFAHSWNAGSPAGGGSDQIYRVGDWYFVHIDDAPLQGPYEDLATALNTLGDSIALSPTTERIECTELSTGAIAEMLHWDFENWIDPGEIVQHRFMLNTEPWVVKVEDGRASFSRLNDS